MKNQLKNTGYFFVEAVRVIRMNRLSNLFSFMGTVLILFVLGLVVSGWRISSRLVMMLKEEAEISAYFNEQTDDSKARELVNQIRIIDGVGEAQLINADEAQRRMEKILGEEAHILALFDESPFEDYIEIHIHLDKMDDVLEEVKKLEGVDYVRDNREILGQMEAAADIIETLGLIVLAAVSITTLVIVSHMIRQGIYQNREHIYTLKLLGAPDAFIGFPYLLVGLLLTLAGGGVASLLIATLLNQALALMGGMLTFIPLPSGNELIFWPVLVIMGISIILGIIGSLSGLSSANREKG